MRCVYRIFLRFIDAFTGLIIKQVGVIINMIKGIGRLGQVIITQSLARQVITPVAEVQNIFSECQGNRQPATGTVGKHNFKCPDTFILHSVPEGGRGIQVDLPGFIFNQHRVTADDRILLIPDIYPACIRRFTRHAINIRSVIRPGRVRLKTGTPGFTVIVPCRLLLKVLHEQ